MKRFVIAIFLLITFSLACKTLLPTESPAGLLLTSEVFTPSLTTENIVPEVSEPSVPITASPELAETDVKLFSPKVPAITFAINVHDWTHPDESAQILLRLIDLFEKNGVRGDFYFTEQITRQLVEQHPEVIQRFKQSDMTINYHVRAPHPLVSGFGAELKNLDKDDYLQTMLDYETFALDLETGGLDHSRSGGYTYVAEIFGSKPVVVPKSKVYAELGGQMVLVYHEEGTKIEQPFDYVHGMLIRPSDFSVTRNTIIDGSDNFWWNMISTPNGADYHPVHILELYLTEWDNHDYARAPFITSLIHENNFYRSGPVGWSSIYYSVEQNKRKLPVSPPYDLNAPDPSHLRSEKDREAIWQAYEALVAYAAQNLNVVTSQDILMMAEKSR
jgi:hypothetical protein